MGLCKTQFCSAVKGAESLLASGKVAGSEWLGLAGSVHPDLPSGSWGLDPQQTSTGQQEAGEWYRTFLLSTDRDGEGDAFTPA